MANTIKILGQLVSTGSLDDLYQVPSGNTSTVISSLMICNRSADPANFRISVSEDGAAISNKDYIYYDVLIAGNDTFAATLGITLSADDVVRAYGSNTNLSFNIFGQENS